MILKQLIIYSFKNKIIEKEYSFNDFGLNIILGVKKDDNDESNGVGKTTMVECIKCLLGSSIPVDFVKSTILYERDIFLVLKISINDSIVYLGKRINEPENGYVLNIKNLSFNLDNWSLKGKKEYKDTINTLIFNNKYNENMPSFSALSEYIIRDEKKGFMDILLPNRNALYQHLYLAFLFCLPFNSELEICEIKKPLKSWKEQLSLIKAISKEIENLRIEKRKIEKEVSELEKIIQNLDIPEKYNDDIIKYSDYKSKLNSLQKEIFEKEHIISQYKKNIDNLQDKVNELKQMNDIEPFYEQMLGYFPQQIEKNLSEVLDFYNFMVESRGKYFKNKIAVIENEMKDLYKEKRILLEKINQSTKIFNEEKIIEDLSNVTKEVNKYNERLAEINLKIDMYERKNEINKEINKIKQNIIGVTDIKNDEFKVQKDNISTLAKIFNELMEQAYNEQGILDFEFDNKTGETSSTGRVKIMCKINDEKSHGRLYMKINMFDLTWFLNRVRQGKNISFIIHDGSYCKPDKEVKVRLLKYVDTIMKTFGRGQYFITINIDELDAKELEYFKKSKQIVAELNRSNGHKNRFFGFKYN